MKPHYFLHVFVIMLLLIASSNSFGQIGVYSAGDGAGFSNSSGDFNTFIGDSAGYTNTTGLYNTFLGYRAGYNLNFATFTQSDNTVIGAEAMAGNPFSNSSTDNVIIGKMAGYNHYGSDVVIIGTHAGYYNENGADVVFIGEEAGYSNTTGDDNVFVGEDAGYNNTTASDNTFIGNQAGKTNTTGSRNTFLGNEAGWDNTIGYRNTFLGDSAGIDNGEGHHNTMVGQACGSNTEYADYNTFVGSYAGWDNNRTNETNNANYNTYLGYYTGFTNREGQYNVLIGALTDFSTTAMSGNGATNSYNIGIGFDALINGERVYSCVIGSNARVSSDNSCVIGGTTSVTRMSVGIGTDTPDQDASLELAENDKGFLINRLSNSEKTTFASALASSDEGMMVYDSTSQHLSIWNGSQWMKSGVQNLSLSTNILSIADGNSVSLAPYLDNTDAQDLSLAGNILSLTNDGTTVNLSGYLDNTDTQDLSLSGNTLSLTNDGTTVDLSAYLDDTDTDDQTLSLVTNTLSIADGNSVDLAGYLDNTDAQDLTLTGNTLALTNDGTPVDLSAYLDDTDTDDQSLSLSSNTLSIEDGNSVDLGIYLDNTDSQDLAFDGINLSITGGNSIDISSLKDGFEANTDEQNLNLASDILSITGGNFVNLSPYLDNTDDQTLSLLSNTLSITDGNSVDLTAYLDNTDEQTLAFDGTNISISGGNSIDISSAVTNTDEQNLTSASLTGTVLEISIENGSPVSVDLAPLFTDINNTITNHENRIADLEADVAYLQSLNTKVTNAFIEGTGIELYQNIPNPTNGSTRIQFFVPEQISSAVLIIYDNKGAILKRIDISERGLNFVDLNLTDLSAGYYYYSLLVDGRNAGSKKMSIAK